jgi:hypothetical protein
MLIILSIIAFCIFVSTTVLVFSAWEIRKWRSQYVEALYKLWNLEEKDKQ